MNVTHPRVLLGDRIGLGKGPATKNGVRVLDKFFFFFFLHILVTRKLIYLSTRREC